MNPGSSPGPSSTHRPLLPLAMLRVGESARVAEVRGGRGCVSRLIALGVVPGVEIEVVRNAAAGPLIVRLHGSRLALGRGIAHRIMLQGAR